MSPTVSSQPPPQPRDRPDATRLRVAVVTFDKVHTSLAGAAWLQFPRALSTMADVELIDLPTYFGSLDWQLPRATFKLMVRSGMSQQEALRRVPIRQRADLPHGHFDVVLVLCTSPFDLFAIRWVEDLLGRTDKVAAWMIELWEPDMGGQSRLSEPTELFDGLFIGNETGDALLRASLGHDSIHYLPPAADVDLFDRFRVDGYRPIAAMNVGRRAKPQHDYLFKRAMAESRHYLFDTITPKGATDPKEHHEAYAFAAGRSEVMVSNYCRFDQPTMIGHSRDVPARIFEGGAAGCLIAGEAGDGALRNVGIDPDIVVPFGLDGDTSVLDQVLRDGDAVAQYANAARAMACTVGDYSHRWRDLAVALGLDPGEPTRQRIDRLATKAGEDAAAP